MSEDREFKVAGFELIPRFNSGMGGVSILWEDFLRKVCDYQDREVPEDWPHGKLLSLKEAKMLAVKILEAWDAASNRQRTTANGGPWDWNEVIDMIDEMEANSRA